MKNLEPHIMTFDEKMDLFEKYKQSNKRLLLLDYDGTLVPFVNQPKDAEPSGDLKILLRELCARSENEVILISGRDAFTLDSWFPDEYISLVAEHGALYRQKHKGWIKFDHQQPEWKQSVQMLFEKYKGLYSGALVELKAFSVAFHYRQVSDPFLEQELKQKIADDLVILKNKFDFSVIDGSKVIEVKNNAINKGNFVTELLRNNFFDFVLAIGDDATDEDMFDALSKYDNSCTIKVGITETNAKLNIVNANNIISLLEQLTNFRGLQLLNSKN